ncbi:MAG: transketolase C-terminal domain-containing protein [Anaerolineae bacterium]
MTGAINMVYGAACGRARRDLILGPGISLMQEGMSYIARLRSAVRHGRHHARRTGLGDLGASQADYFQLVKGGGHGDYHSIVLAPSSVQEAADLTYTAFDLAEKYRTIVVIAADGNIGQSMEPVEMPVMRTIEKKDHGWELTGAKGRAHRVILSIGLQPEVLEAMNLRLQAKYDLIQATEVQYSERFTDDADVLVVAFGTAARIATTAIREARAHGLRVGLLRPITLWPFPSKRLAELTQTIRRVLVVEMNAGQMVEDVRLAVNGQARVEFYGRTGGAVPMPDEILERIEALALAPAPRLDSFVQDRRVGPIFIN